MEYGLIGEHLPHSFSKIIHGMIGDYNYILNEIEPDNLDSFMKAKDFKAINVTIPYKQAVIPYLDEISPEAKAIGAVNTIVNRDGRLYGYNTDIAGITALTRRTGIDLTGKKVLILGTGGTSKTAAYMASTLGASRISFVSRSRGDAESTPDIVKNDTTVIISRITYDEALNDYKDTDVIINTTPVGMYPGNDKAPIDLSAFEKLSGLVDVIYNPLRTRLVQEALERDIPATGGLYMLVSQAVVAARYFGVLEGDESLIEAETERIYSMLAAQRENIVLIGMPGSGKSTIGKKLARTFKRKLIDTDALITKRLNGVTISDYIVNNGEKAFRDIESEAVAEASSNTGVIIATGGGAILREDNVRALGQNGKLIFLDRPLDTIQPTEDRPLSDNYEKLKALKDVRQPIYEAAADIIIDNSDTADAAVKKILDSLGIQTQEGMDES